MLPTTPKSPAVGRVYHRWLPNIGTTHIGVRFRRRPEICYHLVSLTLLLLNKANRGIFVGVNHGVGSLSVGILTQELISGAVSLFQELPAQPESGNSRAWPESAPKPCSQQTGGCRQGTKCPNMTVENHEIYHRPWVAVLGVALLDTIIPYAIRLNQISRTNEFRQGRTIMSKTAQTTEYHWTGKNTPHKAISHPRHPTYGRLIFACRDSQGSFFPYRHNRHFVRVGWLSGVRIWWRKFSWFWWVSSWVFCEGSYGSVQCWYWLIVGFFIHLCHFFQPVNHQAM